MFIWRFFVILTFSCEIFCQELDQGNIKNSKHVNDEVINLAVVACGDRVKETLVLLKSALMFTESYLHFIIITEKNLKQDFTKQFKEWPEYVQKQFNFTLMEPRFPKENENEWKSLFKPCASQRIFLPEVLKTTDSILYVDTDVLFISDIADVWNHFKKFNSTHLAALAPEHEDPNMGWYNRFARHPFYGKLGLNSGVMLMNLTRMREFGFVKKIFPLYQEYKNAIPWGDQCLLNILFHFHPDQLYVYDCSWNYRPDHCMYGSNCYAAEVSGAKVLHGCRRCFHNDKIPAFKAVYKVFDLYEFKKKQQKKLFKRLKKLYTEKAISNSYCGKDKARENIFKTIQKSFERHQKIYKLELEVEQPEKFIEKQEL